MKRNIIAALILSAMMVTLLTGCACNHKWNSATCTEPKTCAKCGETEGIPLGHVWTEATSTMPATCLVCREMQALPLPASGQVFIGADLYCESYLTITCSSNESCYIKLKDEGKNDVFSFFVRSGDTVEVPVPAETLYAYFSYGKDWYGPEYVFGPGTSYGMDDEPLDLYNYEYTYTLQPVTDGNFSETPIDADDF